VSETIPLITLLAVTIGLSLSTLMTRTCFLVAGSRIRLSHHAEVALRYAPVCTLAAIIAPDVLLHGPGSPLDLSPLNPRLVGAAAAAIWLCFSRHIVGCMIVGMLAYSVARIYF
jgi:branched-subunit amino acid transport protein